MGKKENIAIFEDTRRISQTHEILGNVLAFTNAYQSIYRQGVPKYVLTPYFADPAKVIVSRKRTLEAASAYKGQRICVLSFASATNPGGGVNWGATGQEESICRCSTGFLRSDFVEQSFHFLFHQKLNFPGMACNLTKGVGQDTDISVFQETADKGRGYLEGEHVVLNGNGN